MKEFLALGCSATLPIPWSPRLPKTPCFFRSQRYMSSKHRKPGMLWSSGTAGRLKGYIVESCSSPEEDPRIPAVFDTMDEVRADFIDYKQPITYHGAILQHTDDRIFLRMK